MGIGCWIYSVTGESTDLIFKFSMPNVSMSV